MTDNKELMIDLSKIEGNRAEQIDRKNVVKKSSSDVGGVISGNTVLKSNQKKKQILVRKWKEEFLTDTPLEDDRHQQYKQDQLITGQHAQPNGLEQTGEKPRPKNSHRLR